MMKAVIRLLIVAIIHWNSSAMDKSIPQMNFVMFTDDNYIVPTLVTLHSLLKYCKTPKRIIIFFKATDPESTITNLNLLSQLVVKNSDNNTSLTFVNANHKDITEMASTINISRDQGKDALKVKMILPQLFGNSSAKSYGDTNDMKIEESPIILYDYIWLDTDILIRDDISELYKDCRESNAPIGSANLLFFDMSGSNKNILYEDEIRKKFSGGVGLLAPKNFAESIAKSVTHSPLWRSSGGVLYFNLKKTKELINSFYSSSTKRLIDDECYWDMLICSSNSSIRKVDDANQSAASEMLNSAIANAFLKKLEIFISSLQKGDFYWGGGDSTEFRPDNSVITKDLKLLTMIWNPWKNSEIEQIFFEIFGIISPLLQKDAPNAMIYAFSPIYNCRPPSQSLATNIINYPIIKDVQESIIWTTKSLQSEKTRRMSLPDISSIPKETEPHEKTRRMSLPDISSIPLDKSRPSINLLKHYIGMGIEDSLVAVNEVAQGRVIVWHWDSVKKPWNYAKNWGNSRNSAFLGKLKYDADRLWFGELAEIQQEMKIEVKKVNDKLEITPQNKSIPADWWNSITIDGAQINESSSFPKEWFIIEFLPSKQSSIPVTMSSSQNSLKKQKSPSPPLSQLQAVINNSPIIYVPQHTLGDNLSCGFRALDIERTIGTANTDNNSRTRLIQRVIDGLNTQLPDDGTGVARTIEDLIIAEIYHVLASQEQRDTTLRQSIFGFNLPVLQDSITTAENMLDQAIGALWDELHIRKATNLPEKEQFARQPEKILKFAFDAGFESLEQCVTVKVAVLTQLKSLRESITNRYVQLYLWYFRDNAEMLQVPDRVNCGIMDAIGHILQRNIIVIARVKNTHYYDAGDVIHRYDFDPQVGTIVIAYTHNGDGHFERCEVQDH